MVGTPAFVYFIGPDWEAMGIGYRRRQIKEIKVFLNL